MISKQLYSFLQDLNLDNTAITSANYEKYTNKDLSKNLKLIAPEAVYFFNKKPLILFFDISTLTDTEREKQIHKKVWSFDNSPIIFIIKNSEIQVFNALNFVKAKNRLEEIAISKDEIIQQFSLLNLESGAVWKSFQENYLRIKKGKDHHKRVNDRLFQNIKDVRLELTKKTQEAPLKEEEANSLILRIIFIRYLIDREIEIDERYIFGSNIDLRRKSFSKLIKENNNLNNLFNLLNDKFNGVLFRETFICLTETQAEYLSNVFRGEIEDEGNLFAGFFFEIFDFSIIPVEVISGIYESLIDEEIRNLDSAVYTPAFLVDYILNDTVDKFLFDNKTSECKVFEVAVGSGIFLVQSLRRMIEREIELNGRDDKNAFSNRIREIAKRNLFGIDINNEALKVTCFSIYIALLDYQDPRDINHYSFPNFIGENLFNANFFGNIDSLGNLIASDFEDTIKNNQPEVILGNPPWKSKKDDPIHLKWLKLNNKTVGRYEIAQSFLLRTKDFMSDHTVSSLVVTSTMFFNVSRKTKAFKKEFLTSSNIHKILDLSPVRRLIFEQKNSPAIVVNYSKSLKNNHLTNTIEHQSVKWNYFLKHFKMLVIEKYDIKQIAQKNFIDFDWMFKVALYGNTLDFVFLKRVQNLCEKQIFDVIDSKETFKGSGIERGANGKLYEDLIGIPIIENEQLSQDYTVVSDLKRLSKEDAFLSRGRDLNIFLGNKILIKEQNDGESKPFVSFVEDTVAFRKGVFSISSTDTNTLVYIYSILKSKFAQYFLFSIGGAWGIGTRPAIRFNDELLAIPLKDSSHNEELIKYGKRYITTSKKHHSKPFPMGEPPINSTALSSINTLVGKALQLQEHEKDIIDYSLNISRYQFQSSKQDLITEFTTHNESDYRNKKSVLRQYAEVYIQEFKDIYPEEFISIEIHLLKHFIAINFIFTNIEPKETITYEIDGNVSSTLSKLANNLSVTELVDSKDSTKSLFIQKDIKGFEKNSFYVIKPNEYKCWHRAMAWYDVAEFKEAIQASELSHLS